MQEGLSYIMDWYNANSIKANPNKFQFILINQNNNLEMTLNIQDTILVNQDQVKLLGVTIDKNLNFKKHINTICETAQNRLYALLRIRNI